MTTSENLLKTILTLPTSPFREEAIQTFICHTLRQSKVPYCRDAIGNILIGFRSLAEYQRALQQKSKQPLCVFVAHMDHPGFHGTTWIDQNELAITWHGGSPVQKLEGASVWLADRKEPAKRIPTTAIMGSVQLKETGRSIATATISIPSDFVFHEHTDAADLFGGFWFEEAVWEENRCLYTKAADDLVGSWAIVQTAIDLWKTKSKHRTQFAGLLTRAEEVGFIGMLGHLEAGFLQKAKRQVLVVSLETSRALPQAEIGQGPVVRLGDRSTVFSSQWVHILAEVAKKVLPEKHQKRVMDGGVCEAGAALAYGIPAIGISIPLGNYHNQSFEGGPRSRGPDGPAPEFVHLDDAQGMLTLCKGLLTFEGDWKNPWKPRQQELSNLFKKYRLMLAESPVKSDKKTARATTRKKTQIKKKTRSKASGSSIYKKK